MVKLSRKSILYSALVLSLAGSVLFTSLPVYATSNSSSSSESTSSNEKSEEKTEEEKKAEEAKISAIQSSIANKEQQIKEAEDEKKKINSGLTDIKAIKAKLVAAKASLAQYVTELDENATAIQEKIDSLTEEIKVKEEEIVQAEEDLNEAIEMRDEQYDSMKKRLQVMYENGGDTYYINILTTSSSFGDFLNKMDYINEISEYDNKMFEEFAENVEYVEVCKTSLETEKDLLDTTRTAAEEERKALEELISEKEAEIAAYEADIRNQQALIDEYEAYIAEQNSIIAELEKAVALEKENLQSARSYDGGKFCWPAPSYNRISDDYGWRLHPTLNVQKFHNGVDLAAPGGSNILAAYDGKVVGAAYSSTMGNYVMIDHGDGLYTVYMHASSLCVSSGQEVTKGQVIAKVGTTGRSTGNHLHFGVRLNGEYVSPWGYISAP